MPTLGHVAVKLIEILLNIKILNFLMILIFHKNIQIRVPDSGNATVKYFIESLKFRMFLKMVFV